MIPTEKKKTIIVGHIGVGLCATILAKCPEICIEVIDHQEGERMLRLGEMNPNIIVIDNFNQIERTFEVSKPNIIGEPIAKDYKSFDKKSPRNKRREKERNKKKRR